MFPLHDDRQHASGAVRANANSLFQGFPSSQAQRRQSTVWWSQTGSNRRPHACKARALPTELWPQVGGPSRKNRAPKMVGLGRLELPTSRLSSARSNQLSYKPKRRPTPNLAVAAPFFAHQLFPKSLTTFRADATRRARPWIEERETKTAAVPPRSA